MLLFLSALIGVAAAGVFVAGLIALLNNSTQQQNRRFFMLTVLLSLWMTFNFADSNITKPFWTDALVKLDFITALFLAWLFVEFVNVFEIRAPGKLQPAHGPARTVVAILANVVLSILIILGLVAKTTIQGNMIHIAYTSLFAVYVAVVFTYFIYGFGKLLYKRRFAHRDSRAGISLVFGGLITGTATNILTNVVFPLTITDHTIVRALNVVGYLGLATMVLAIYISITTQRLFEVRLIVIRSVAYILALASIGVAFIVLTLGITAVVIRNNLNVLAERSIYAFLVVALAIAFPWMRQRFDKLTDRLFYRDAYDPQVFLGQLNQTLVSSIELEKLLKTCAQIIADNLKAEYCIFGIKETGFKGIRAIGTTKKEFNAKDIEKARRVTPHLGTNVIVADYLPPEVDKFKELLARNNVAVIVRLVPEFAREKDGLEGLGYILLGQKRSGNIYTSQDMRMLGIISNELVIAIQNALHFEEIQRFNITLQEKVDQATRELRRTNKRLEELDETKDDFISMASHQLRTPLTSVKGYLSMVLEGDAGKLNTSQSKMLNQAFSSSQRMVYLITDLLNVSRLKTGKFIINPAPINLSEIAEEEVSQLIETAEARHIELSYKKPPTFPLLMLDETKIRQVIMNFIDNAIYYTPSGGHIKVELSERPATVELRVVDDGIGVPKSEQHHLFTKFYRAANARKARPDGTGLGLFMAKKVIAAQSGSIVFSSREGQGSTFGFVFSKNHLKVPMPTSPVSGTLKR